MVYLGYTTNSWEAEMLVKVVVQSGKSKIAIAQGLDGDWIVSPIFALHLAQELLRAVYQLMLEQVIK